MFTLNPHCRRVDKPLNETILIETNFSKSKITTRRSIKWEEIDFPGNWTIKQAVPSQPVIQNNLIDVIQTPEGLVRMQFENNNNLIGSSSRLTKSSSLRSFISPIDYVVDTPSRMSTSAKSRIQKSFETIPEDHIDELRINKDFDNIVKGVTHTPTEADITASEMEFRY